MPDEFVFLLLGRELMSRGVPARPPGLSKMSSKGAWLLLPLGLPACRKLLFLLCEEALFCPGDAALPSAGAVNAEASDIDAVLAALQDQYRYEGQQGSRDLQGMHLEGNVYRYFLIPLYEPDEKDSLK